MWRCFRPREGFGRIDKIFSTYVEVFLCPVVTKCLRCHFLHVCGGVSDAFALWCASKKFSPRMWRCFSIWVTDREEKRIFSTYVEVFLRRVSTSWLFRYFLHVCGGVSKEALRLKVSPGFSPRMWRCFRRPVSWTNR